jgi:hypothetical protein
VRKRWIHHDDVARLEFHGPRLTPVQGPHDQASVQADVFREGNANDSSIPPPGRPLRLLVDMRLEADLTARVRKLKKNLRIAELSLDDLAR